MKNIDRNAESINLTPILTTHVCVLRGALLHALEREDCERLRAIFANIRTLKQDNADRAVAIQRAILQNFTPLQIVQMKALSKVRRDKVTATSETQKSVLNVLSEDIETQKKKIKSALNNALNRGKYELHFSKSQYLQAYDRLTAEAFTGLYKTGLIRVENVLQLLNRELIFLERQAKKIDK